MFPELGCRITTTAVVKVFGQFGRGEEQVVSVNALHLN